MASLPLTRVAGYRCSCRGINDAPIIRLKTHAPDQTSYRTRILHCYVDLAASGPPYSVAAVNNFHEISRAAGGVDKLGKPSSSKKLHRASLIRSTANSR